MVMTLDELERRARQCLAEVSIGRPTLVASDTHPAAIVADLIAYLREQERRRAGSQAPRAEVLFKRCPCAFGVHRGDCPEHGHLVPP